MRPKAWIYGRAPGNKGALQVKQMLAWRFAQCTNLVGEVHEEINCFRVNY